MARRALDLGEVGTITTVGQVFSGGRWVAAGKKRAERYRARAYYCGYDGVRRDVAVTAASRVRAEDALKARLALVLRGTDDVTMGPATPLVVAGEAWLKEIGRTDSGLSARSVSDYSSTFKRCIDADGSSLRGLSLQQANNPQRLRAFLQRTADERGTGTAKICRTVLTGILGLAVDNGVLESSAMLQIRTVKSQVPKSSDRDHSRALTRAERDEIIAFADELAQTEDTLDPRTRRKRQTTADLIAFMAGTGARIEEARAQEWSAIDLSTGACEIRGTKTQTSKRTVALPDWLLTRLVQRSAGGTQGLVFSSPTHVDDPFRPWDQSNSSRAVRKVLDDSGFSWAIPHTFRRTVATILDDAGVPIRKIADQLGHADASMTARVYLGRDFGSDKSELAELL